MADAGSYGGTTLWIGSVFALVAVLILLASMSGGIEALPDKADMITQWAAGMSVYMTFIAAVCGLAAGGMTTFMGVDSALVEAEAPAAE
ncbi:MAG: hypothetical protein ABGX44_00935 [Candidatus Poseidoniia archaeon]|nr:MAG: hypothetical protein CXT68_05810 [Euryarchaeota archaeon]